MEKNKSFIIFASGEGTNAQALLTHAQVQEYECRGIISDRPAKVLEVASRFSMDATVVRGDETILQVLKEKKPQWAFLAGYKKILSKDILDFFYDEEKKIFRVLNIHPSILPAFPGLGAYENAFQYGVKISGITVHLVDLGLDTGLPVLQEAFSRQPEDTLEKFIARGKEIEHRLFPLALDYAMNNQIRIQEIAGKKFVLLEEP